MEAASKAMKRVASSINAAIYIADEAKKVFELSTMLEGKGVEDLVSPKRLYVQELDIELVQ